MTFNLRGYAYWYVSNIFIPRLFTYIYLKIFTYTFWISLFHTSYLFPALLNHWFPHGRLIDPVGQFQQPVGASRAPGLGPLGAPVGWLFRRTCPFIVSVCQSAISFWPYVVPWVPQHVGYWQYMSLLFPVKFSYISCIVLSISAPMHKVWCIGANALRYGAFWNIY